MDEFENRLYEFLFNAWGTPLDQMAKNVARNVRKDWFVVSKKDIDIYFEEKGE